MDNVEKLMEKLLESVEVWGKDNPDWDFVLRKGCEIIRIQHEALNTIKNECNKTIIHECEKCHEYDYIGAYKGFMAQADIAEEYLEQTNRIAGEVIG